MLQDLALSFGRSTPSPSFLGAAPDATATLPPEGSDPCSLASWYDDELDEHGKPASMSHGSMAVLTALGCTALGGAIGAVIARGLGAAVGAGAGAAVGAGTVASQYLLWRANGGSVKKPGTCGGATGMSAASTNAMGGGSSPPQLVPGTPSTPATPATPKTTVLWDGSPLPKGTTIATDGTVIYVLQKGDVTSAIIGNHFHKSSAESLELVQKNKSFPWGKAPAGSKLQIPKSWVK